MTARQIASIRIELLFGLYTYRIPNTGVLTNAAILYGDNGVGKTTLLRLAFHLLSASDSRGHRTALYGAEFKLIEVTLSSGVTLTAKFLEPTPTKILQLEVLKNDKKLAVWDYVPRGKKRLHDEEGITVEIDERGRPVVIRKVPKPRRKELEGVPYGEPAYLQALEDHVPTLFMLNADRRLDSDAVSDPDDEVEIRRTMMYGEPKHFNELVTRSREIALSQALNRTAKYISRKAVISTNKGAMNVHSVYGDVLRRLVSPNSRTAAAEPIAEQVLMQRLVRIEEKTAEHARYELATSLKTNEFRRALGGRASRKTRLAADLLLPYIESVESRLDAIDPTYQLVDRFVTIVNGLLTDKSVSFKVGQGFAVQNRLGVSLSPGQLSSGEQQLLLLFCYVLTARDAPTVFMVDEPEISLNIKWQRRLVQSLLDITQDANVQFIFASHSLELLAQHRDRVVKLVNRT